MTNSAAPFSKTSDRLPSFIREAGPTVIRVRPVNATTALLEETVERVWPSKTVAPLGASAEFNRTSPYVLTEPMATPPAPDKHRRELSAMARAGRKGFMACEY